MDEETRSKFRRIKDFDPIDTAEKLLGEDAPQEAINAAGFLLLQESIASKRRMSEEIGDIHFGSKAVDAMKLIKSLGFDQIYVERFWPDDKDTNELFLCYWHPKDGLLLVLETYGEKINKVHIYFEILERKHGDWKKFFNLHGSGGLDLCKTHNKFRFFGDIDCRDGILSTIEEVRAAGKLQVRWRSSRHHIWLVSYQDEHESNKHGNEKYFNGYFEKIVRKRFSQFPEEVQKAIGSPM